MKETILHIVPHLPPRVSGVGDFSHRIGKEVERSTNGQLRSRYVAAGWDVAETPASAPEVDLTGRRNASELGRALADTDPAAVLLHYVGYGYEERGHPVWLVDAVRAFRLLHPGVRVMTWFHELYAFGPPWRSSFWLSPWQRRVATDLARLSDVAITNREASADWLRRRAPQTPVEVCPTSSNVGEPEALRPWAERDPVAVVFGSAGQRGAVYAHPDKAVRQLLDRAGVERVVDIGPPAFTPGAYAGRPVETLGKLSSADVSERLQSARVGLVHYPPAFLTKSGIVAAYLAHGVPVCTVSLDARPSGDNPPPFMTESGGEQADLCLVASAGYLWYSRHAHTMLTASRLTRLLKSPVAIHIPKPHEYA